MGAVICVWGQCFDGFNIAAQFVRDDGLWFAKLGNQSLEKALCGFGISPGLYKHIKNVAICVDRPPEPMFLAADCYRDFVHVPLVVRSRAISTDVIREMATKPVNPKPDCFTADICAPFDQQILNAKR